MGSGNRFALMGSGKSLINMGTIHIANACHRIDTYLAEQNISANKLPVTIPKTSGLIIKLLTIILMAIGVPILDATLQAAVTSAASNVVAQSVAIYRRKVYSPTVIDQS